MANDHQVAYVSREISQGPEASEHFCQLSQSEHIIMNDTFCSWNRAWWNGKEYIGPGCKWVTYTTSWYRGVGAHPQSVYFTQSDSKQASQLASKQDGCFPSELESNAGSLHLLAPQPPCLLLQELLTLFVAPPSLLGHQFQLVPRFQTRQIISCWSPLAGFKPLKAKHLLPGELYLGKLGPFKQNAF